MEEGEFSKGEKNGYCRIISAKTGSCQLGFYKNNEPHGKWTSYKPDGSLAEPEGLYEGEVVT
jgi:antitoxin component YwqK of YwqJK toxin-antitoxin module